HSIELRQSARSRFNRQPNAFESIQERPPCRVDGRGILQGRLCLRFHMAEIFATQALVLFERQIAFLFVVFATSANQITNAIRSASRPGDNVINVQDLIARTVVAGVSASVIEFDQDVFAQFKALKFALLILETLDFGILHQLHVEFDQFKRNAFDRICASESARPGIDILDAALERRRQGAFGTPSVIEARLAIAGLSIAASATNRPPRIELGFDRLPAMLDFGGKDDLAAFLIEDCDASRFRSGIELQLQVRRRRIDDLSLENDRERVATEDGGLAGLQKQSGPTWRRRR